MKEEEAQNLVADLVAAAADLDAETDHGFIGELTQRVLIVLGRRALAEGHFVGTGDVRSVIQQYAVRPAEIRRKAREDCARAGREMLQEAAGG